MNKKSLTKSVIKVEKFENYRAEKGLSKSQFCRACGISVSTYNKILAQSSDVFLGTIFKILKFTNLHFCDIF